MKIVDYRWIGMLVHDSEATCDFFESTPGLAVGSVKWTHFWGPDGQFYSLQQYDE